MKTTYASLFFALSLPAFAQKAGDSVTPDALGKLDWVQGAAPAAWEPGKVYILECWATWCGPCIAAIPHVDALYDKYQEKGLRVIGVNVWEDGKDKVAEFVKKKGEGMSYPVAYTGKGGVFETDWLKPAGVRGIPHAFVVKDGKVLLTTHPAQLSEPVIEGLLAGGEAETKALQGIQENQRKQENLAKAMQNFRQAAAKKDLGSMEAAIEELKVGDPKNAYVPAMSFELAVAKSDWSTAEGLLGQAEKDPVLAMAVTGSARKLADNAEAPAGFRKGVATTTAKVLEKGDHPTQHYVLSKLQWSLGEKEAAIATAKRAVAETAPTAGRPAFPAAPFERFAAALEKGEMPTDAEFNGWLREALPQAPPAAPVKPKDE